MDITKVIFRKFKNGEIIALFPELTYRDGYFVETYMMVGEHGPGEYNHLIKITKLATENEYDEMKKELENYYKYNLKVMKRGKVKYILK